MPSLRKRSRNCGTVIWFCAATLLTARSISASSTFWPISRAKVIWTRSSIKLSTTCWRKASASGGLPPPRRTSAPRRSIRCATSTEVTASVLTTATMKSPLRLVRAVWDWAAAGMADKQTAPAMASAVARRH